MIYIFKVIWFPDRKIADKEVVLKMILFDNLSNNFNSTEDVDFVEILCFNTNV